MRVIHTIEELRSARASLAEPVGLVPTMGYLHQGHLSLVKAAHRDCASVVVSIFVNPSQFGPQEDLARYPRDLDHDLALLQQENVDIVWVPDSKEMYPENYQCWITVENLTKPLEGEIRPTHFRGVITIVAKLFNAVQPQKAFFGQKDAQQAQVISRMVADLNYQIEIKTCPIIREVDGLAMSSRNSYLSHQERQAAPVLYHSLQIAKNAFKQGERHTDIIKQLMMNLFLQEPLAKVQYIACVDPQNFEELATIKDKALILLAVYLGNTRLIDNMFLGQ